MLNITWLTPPVSAKSLHQCAEIKIQNTDTKEAQDMTNGLQVHNFHSLEQYIDSMTHSITAALKLDLPYLPSRPLSSPDLQRAEGRFGQVILTDVAVNRWSKEMILERLMGTVSAQDSIVLNNSAFVR